MSNPRHSREMLVRAEDLADARAALKQDGLEEVLLRLLAREPVLVEFLMKTWDEVYRELREKRQTGQRCVSARQKMTSALVTALTAQDKAHYRLWKNTAVGTLLERIDPSLAFQSP